MGLTESAVIAAGGDWSGAALIVATASELVRLAIPGSAQVPGSVGEVCDPDAVWDQWHRLHHGSGVVLISRRPYACRPSASCGAAMRIGGYLRQ